MSKRKHVRLATPAQIADARAHHADRDIVEIDEDALVAESEYGDGVWVQAWVFVVDEDAIKDRGDA